MQALPAVGSLRRASDGSCGAPRALRRVGVVALALLLGACWYPKERGARLEQRVERVEGASPGQVDAAAAEVREQGRRVDAAFAEMKAWLEELERAPKPSAEGQARQADRGEELKRLLAMLEQQGQRLDAQGRRLDALERSLAQARRGAGERVAEPRAPAPTAAPEKSAARPAPELPHDKAGYLAFGREQEAKGEKAVAREVYEQYVVEFPTDPGSAEAHFRLGELAFGERRYRDAVLEFGKVAKEFPRSDRAPEALLRTGESMLRLDMKDEAVAVLNEVPQRYPGTPAAARAKKRLAEVPRASAAAGK